MSAPLRRWRVTVITWLSLDAIIDATSEANAKLKGSHLFANDVRRELFRAKDGGIDGVVVEEVLP